MLKKAIWFFFFFIICMSATSLSLAATGTTAAADGNYTIPRMGDRTFEIGLAPLGANPISLNSVRLRQFRSGGSALRLDAFIIHNSQRVDNDRRDAQLDIYLAPGLQWNLLEVNRVTAYYGVEVPMHYRTTIHERNGRTDRNLVDGFFEIGATALMGLDVHFLSRLYLGAEVGYGFSYRAYSDIEQNNQTQPVNAVDFFISPLFVPTMRLGIIF